MRTIVHLSDLHFGHVDPRTLKPLTALVQSLKPDVVVVSGDLTQRAKVVEFREARAFLDTLPRPQIVVPGNHDIPLHNLWKRFASPLSSFTSIIDERTEPFLADAEIAIAGLSTARSLTWKGGRVNERQLEELTGRFAPMPPSVVKIVVTHHPFEIPPSAPRSDLVGGAHAAMASFARAGVDLLLSGHLHLTHTGRTAERYGIAGHSALVVHAGTATSTRHRGETNSFNVLRLDGHELRLTRYFWNVGSETFTPHDVERYARGAEGWDRLTKVSPSS
ncbi:MAG: metallophosphoesterase family protein [Thermoanaerobaculia bacterium]